MLNTVRITYVQALSPAIFHLTESRVSTELGTASVEPTCLRTKWAEGKLHDL